MFNQSWPNCIDFHKNKNPLRSMVQVMAGFILLLVRFILRELMTFPKSHTSGRIGIIAQALHPRKEIFLTLKIDVGVYIFWHIHCRKRRKVQGRLCHWIPVFILGYRFNYLLLYYISRIKYEKNKQTLHKREHRHAKIFSHSNQSRKI